MKRPLVQAGDVIHVPEAHYLYGTGTLTMRVTAVGVELDRYPNLEWVALTGQEIRWDGTEGQERDVLVRVGALLVPGAVRRRG